jgi:hypothetical protein
MRAQTVPLKAYVRFVGELLEEMFPRLAFRESKEVGGFTAGHLGEKGATGWTHAATT